MARENTDKIKIHNNAFYGGASLDFKFGIESAFYSSRAFDFRSKASQMSVLPGARQIGNITDLLEDMDQDLNGVRYGVGHNGSVWKIDTSDNQSKIAQLSSNGAAGIYYSQNTDQLYIAGQQTVSMYGQVTTGNANNPQFRSDNFAQSASTSPAVTQLYNPSDNSYDGALRSTGTTNTYSLLTSMTEDSMNRCSFSPDIEPFYSIKVYVVTPGTGNWTLTLHDSLNNQLATVTVNNANLTAGALTEFKLSSPVRAIVNQIGVGNGAAYHFHLTSSVADGTCGVVNTSDLSSCNFQLFAYRLVAPHNGWHPMVPFAQFLCIGNERYLSTYDFTADSGPNNQQWVRHQLTFRQGYEVCGLATNDQYLVIALERRSTNANRNYQDGQLAFWDGGSQGINFYIDIPMGAPYGLHTFNNITYFYCGSSLYAWAGGKTVMKVRAMAYQNTDYLGSVDSTVVGPHMMDTRYNLLMLGYPSRTTNANINYGVYSWGAVEMVYPNSWGYSYSLSNGVLNNNTNGISNFQIGCVKNFVDAMYISWQYTDSNGTHYGLDLVDNFSTAATFADWQSLIYDGGVVYKTKNALRMKVKFLPLPSGCTLKAKYAINRGAYVYSPSASAGDTFLKFEIHNGRFEELQWGVEITCPPGLTTPPTVTGVTMEVDPLTEEVNL